MSECKKVMCVRCVPCDLIGCGGEHLPIQKLLFARQVHARLMPGARQVDARCTPFDLIGLIPIIGG